MLVHGLEKAPDLMLHRVARISQTPEAAQDRALRLTAELLDAEPTLSEDEALRQVFAERPELYKRYRSEAVIVGPRVVPSKE